MFYIFSVNFCWSLTCTLKGPVVRTADPFVFLLTSLHRYSDSRLIRILSSATTMLRNVLSLLFFVVILTAKVKLSVETAKYF